MLRVILVFLTIFTFFTAQAERIQPAPSDSSKIVLRQFDAEVLREYRLDKDFNYGEVQPDISLSLWERFWKWFWEFFTHNISSSNTGSVFKYIIIALGIAALIFLIVKLSGMDLTHLYSGKPKEISIPFGDRIEDIHQISFDEEIEKALNNKDLRLAVRLLYLKTLKALNSRGKIKWEPDKTNSNYIQELHNTNYQEQFKMLTKRFEFVWYGKFPVDEVQYTKISQSFQDFNAKVR